MLFKKCISDNVVKRLLKIYGHILSPIITKKFDGIEELNTLKVQFPAILNLVNS